MPPTRSRPALALHALLVLLALSVGPLGAAFATGPLPAFSVAVTATPSYGTAPLQVAFTSSVGAGTPTSFNWTFGDGTFYNGTNASAAAPSHTYSTPGTYVTALTVFEGSQSGRASIGIHVVASPLSASVTVSALRGSAPLTVTFDSSVSGGTATYVNFSWNLGDGGSGSGNSIRYTYSHPGTFHAVLTVFDSGNASTSAGVWVNVTAATVSPASPLTTALALLPWIVGGFAVGALVFWLVSRARRSPNVATSGASDLNTPTGSVPSPVPAASVGEPSPVPESPRAEPPSPSRYSNANGEESLLVSQRVILHIARQGRLGPDEVAVPAFTQGGMADALGVPQTSLTNVLRRLVAGGVLEEDTRHVQGKDRRMKVYHLTPRGERLAVDLRTRPKGP